MNSRIIFWSMYIIILALFTACKSNIQLLSSAIPMDVTIEESIQKLTLYRNIIQDDFYEEECETVIVEFYIHPENCSNIKTKFNGYDFSYNCYDGERNEYKIFKDLDWIIPKLKYSPLPRESFAWYLKYSTKLLSL